MKSEVKGQSPNSDHYWFGQHMVPSIFVYTLGGVAHYHDPLDPIRNPCVYKDGTINEFGGKFFQTFLKEFLDNKVNL